MWPLPGLWSIPPETPFHVEPLPERLEIMKQRYYSAMGWDPETTKPLRETLERYGLDEVLARYDQF